MNANTLIDIRQVGPTCWIAYIRGSRQAVWETVNFSSMLTDLKSKGYSSENIQH